MKAAPQLSSHSTENGLEIHSVTFVNSIYFLQKKKVPVERWQWYGSCRVNLKKTLYFLLYILYTWVHYSRWTTTSELNQHNSVIIAVYKAIIGLPLLPVIQILRAVYIGEYIYLTDPELKMTCLLFTVNSDCLVQEFSKNKRGKC